MIRLAAADPRDHLAALGLLCVLDASGHRGATLAWARTNDSHAAVLLAGASLAGLAAALREDIAAWQGSPLRRIPIAQWPVTLEWPPGREQAQTQALVGTDEDRAVVVTAFNFSSGQSTMERWLDAALDEVTAERAIAELAGERIAYVRTRDLRWRGHGPRSSAYGPPALPQMGLDYLAWRGLTARPMMLGVQAGVDMTRNGFLESFGWPVWTEPLTWAGAKRAIASLAPTWRSRVCRYGLHGAYRTFNPAQWEGIR